MTSKVIYILFLNETEVVAEIVSESDEFLTVKNPTRINVVAVVDPQEGLPAQRIFLSFMCPYSTSEEFSLNKSLIMTRGEISDALLTFYNKTVENYLKAKAEQEQEQKEAAERKAHALEAPTPEADTLKDLEKAGKIHYLHHTGPKTKQ